MRRVLAAVLFICLTLTAFAAEKKAKNIILLIGDGMGPQAVGLVSMYARYAPSSIYKDKISNYEKLAGVSDMGMMFTKTNNTLVTDSACSGTQIASGVYCNPGQVGIDFNKKPAKTILEYAKASGKATGLITTVYLQDATPAVFVSHQSSRGNKNDIAIDMIRTGPEVILGGGVRYFRDTNMLKEAEEKGYQLAYNKEDMQKLKGGKILGLFAEDANPFAIDKPASVPSLKEMTEKALDVLSKDKDGFFIMIEGGAIDWFEHGNDAGAVLKELLAFDETLGYVKEWASKRDDTLVIVTADHETGGFSFHYSYLGQNENMKKTAAGEVLYSGGAYYVSPKVFDEIYSQSRPLNAMKAEYESGKPSSERMVDILQSGNIFIDDKFARKFKSFDAVMKEYDRLRGIVWATNAHSATPVPVISSGPTSENYKGLFHTTELNKKMMNSFGFTYDK